jgi:hypothetical protein
VPKTGGCSIANFPWNPGNGHDTFADFESKLGDEIKNVFVWAFVRNPWARIASAYEDCPEVWGAAPTFRIFLETLAANWSDLDGVKQARFSSTYKFGLPVGRIHFLPQCLLLNDANGNLGVDFVGRFENMAEDLAKVQKRLGPPRTTTPGRTKTGDAIRPWPTYTNPTWSTWSANFSKKIGGRLDIRPPFDIMAK